MLERSGTQPLSARTKSRNQEILAAVTGLFSADMQISFTGRTDTILLTACTKLLSHTAEALWSVCETGTPPALWDQPEGIPQVLPVQLQGLATCNWTFPVNRVPSEACHGHLCQSFSVKFPNTLTLLQDAADTWKVRSSPQREKHGFTEQHEAGVLLGKFCQSSATRSPFSH